MRVLTSNVFDVTHLIELRLARDCVALDQRIRNILEGVGVKIRGSLDKHYEHVERELIERSHIEPV